MELFQASNQWRSRPADERFTSLTELSAFANAVRHDSRQRVLSSRQMLAAPVENDENAIVILGPNGAPVTPTHWAFGQLASRAGAPPGYLRELPAPLAADCLNYGLQHGRDIEDIGVLLRKDATAQVPTLAAVTGPNYGRIWNATVIDSLVQRFGDGVTGAFKVPGEFGVDVPVTKENTTLYASDRDMWVFLADEKNRIEVPNRRNGKPGSFARGFFCWNSEVGAATFGLATFIFDYVCMNRIVWGAAEYKEVRIRHTASAPDKLLHEVAPALVRYVNSSTASITSALEGARAARLDNVDEFLAKRFTKPQVAAIKMAHLADEQRPIETVWDAVTGATAYARQLSHQDSRVDVERRAGAMMDMAA